MRERYLELPSHVASLAPRDLADARRLAARADAVASGAGARVVLEWRLDLSDGREPIPPAALLELDPRPAIVTWRSAREGGRFDGSLEEYRARVEEAYAAGAIVDVEHASGLLASGALPDRRRVVVSAHRPFARPDEESLDLLESMAASGPAAVKLVVGAADLGHALAVARLQARPRSFAAAVFPMGPASAPGRVLSAHFGAALVYGSVEGGAPTARGQIALGELLSVYDTGRPRRPERLYGVVAEDPAASLSPRVHNALFRSRDLSSLYLPLPVADFDREKPPELESDPPFAGFSVTRPWKLAAASCGVPSEDVRASGAANTLVATRGRWRAENTDVDGIFDPLADHDTGEGRSAVVLGAGGTARAAAVAAKRIGYEVALCARHDDEAEAVASALGVDSIAWADLSATEADLYVNATPIGSAQGDPSALPASLLSGRPLVFDCVYRAGGETPTIAAALAAKCPVVRGLRMFAAQAVRQARLFGVDDARLEEIEALLPPGARP